MRFDTRPHYQLFNITTDPIPSAKLQLSISKTKDMQFVSWKMLKLRSSTQQTFVTNFVFLQLAGPPTWYVSLHSSNAFDNNITCLSITYSIPNGNSSVSTVDADDIRCVQNILCFLQFAATSRQNEQDGLTVHGIVWAINDLA